ncbi:MAG: DUF2231 domain-containing protein [Myxococcota bacterium]
MLPNPLHPAVVHFPIVLALLLPLASALGLLTIRRGRRTAHAWAGVVVLQAALALTCWLALETGEHEEETVERVVAERHIEAHEEAAEGFATLAAAGCVVALLGLLAGILGSTARIAHLGLSLVLLAGGVRVGHLGGELVYRYGAAAAYVSGSLDGHRHGAQGHRVVARGHEHDDHDGHGGPDD